MAHATELASLAFDNYRETKLEVRACFLEEIARQIMNIGDTLIERAVAETGLPPSRIEGERARTIGQLNLFAEVVREGSFVGACIDRSLAERNRKGFGSASTYQGCRLYGIARWWDSLNESRVGATRTNSDLCRDEQH